MNSHRWRLIINGKCAGSDPVRAAVLAMREDGIALDVRVTWEAGDAERYVAEAIADDVGTVIAAGGDGTLSEVATTLAHRDESADDLPTLGLLPLGTANDFAIAAQVPFDALEALQLIRRAPAQAIDLLRIEADDDPARLNWCANLASGGFGTQITLETDESLKKVLGGLAYWVTGLVKMGRIDPTPARVRGLRADGSQFEWSGGFIALGIGNGRQAGGGQQLCPDACIDDGLLECTIVPDLTGEMAATVATLVTEGKYAALDQAATRVQLPWVEIEAPEAFRLNLDGEPVDASRFRIECIAARVRMHLPPDCPLLRLPGNPLPSMQPAPLEALNLPPDILPA